MTKRQFVSYINKRIKAGDSAVSIAREFGVTRQTVWLWRQHQGVSGSVLKLAEARNGKP